MNKNLGNRGRICRPYSIHGFYRSFALFLPQLPSRWAIERVINANNEHQEIYMLYRPKLGAETGGFSCPTSPRFLFIPSQHAESCKVSDWRVGPLLFLVHSSQEIAHEIPRYYQSSFHDTGGSDRAGRTVGSFLQVKRLSMTPLQKGMAACSQAHSARPGIPRSKKLTCCNKASPLAGICRLSYPILHLVYPLPPSHHGLSRKAKVSIESSHR